VNTARVLLAAALLALFAAPALARETISLDGRWESVFADPGKAPPPTAPWEPTTVPGVRSWRPEGPHCLWYRRSFQVPAAWADRRVALRLEGVKYAHRVFVNGREVGSYLGGYEPAEYDVTDHVRLGARNELLVAVQDWTALLAADAEVGGADQPLPFDPQVSPISDALLAPVGSRGWEVGIWQSVSLEARPAVWVKDVFVIPSVRERRLRVEVTARNDGGRTMRAELTARIAAGGEAPRLEPRTVELKAGEERVVVLEAWWPQPRLWSPRDPHLYTLVAGVRAGAVGDSREVRFGFREFWVEGCRMFLNGTPINLLATAAHPMPEYDADPKQAYQIAKDAGCVAMRLHAQPWPRQWYEAADEFGMLIIWESALWCLIPQYGLTRAEFWENAHRHLDAQVRLLRNHPSIIIWSAENELLLCGGDAVQGAEAKVGALADAIRAADPSRPVMFDGDEDPDGKADIVNLHYPRELPRWTAWPEVAYWFDEPIVPDTYPRELWSWDRSKPLYLGEFLWVPPVNVHAGSVLFGDGAYPQIESARSLAKAATWEMQVIAARDAGVAGLCPWNLWEMGPFPNPGSEAHRRAYRPIAAFVREATTHLFAGRLAERTLLVFNDTHRARDLEVRWRLAPEDGAWEVNGSDQVRLEAAGRTRLHVALPVPDLDAALTRASLHVEVWHDGQQRFAEQHEWRLYGRAALSGPVPGAPRRVALYDPRGETAPLLSQLGIRLDMMDESNAARLLRRAGVAVVGKGAFAEPEGPPVVGAEHSLLALLLDYVRRGGVLLVLEQEHYPAGFPLALVGHDSTITFPRYSDHPALAGLLPEDLRHWGPDGFVTRREIAKPLWGGFLPIVDSGGPLGLETAGLAELRLGAGRIFLCQLEVSAKFDVDPAATRVLRNLLAAASVSPPAPAAAAALCGDDAAGMLDTIGLRYQRLQAPLRMADLRGRRTLILDAGEVAGAEAVLHRFVRGGGRVLLHRVTPASLPAVRELIGQPIPLQGGLDGSTSLVDRSGPAAAMSNQDLCWLTPPPPGPHGGPSVSPDIADHAIVRPHRLVGPPDRLEAKAMSRRGDLIVLVPEGPDAGSVGLFTNGVLRGRIEVAEAGWHLVSLRARGTPALGVYPRLEVRVGDAPVASATVPSEEWSVIALLVELPAGSPNLSVAFTNDAQIGGEDRNVWIEWVEWAPVALEPSDLRFHTQPGLLVSLPAGRGHWIVDQVRWDRPRGNEQQAARYLSTLLTNLGCEFHYTGGVAIGAEAMTVADCQIWHRQNGSLYLGTNGLVEAEVEFAREGRYTLLISAHGTPLGGVYPRVEVSVDGELVGAVDLTTGNRRTYSLTAPVAAGLRRIGLAFVNDAWDPPEDRNLALHGLTVVPAEEP